MRELRVLERFKALTPNYEGTTLLQGIGDDASVVQLADHYLVISTDTAVADVHFSERYMQPEQIGRRAALCAISDIAAMAADPGELYLALTAPQQSSESDLEQIYQGVLGACVAGGFRLAGGDFTSGSKLTLTVTVSGYCPSSRPPLLRSGAVSGELIGITGPLGGSGGGLLALQADNSTKYPLAERHLKPPLHIQTALTLATLGASALIDISDGLITDLKHLLKASNLGASINLESIPVAQELTGLALKQPLVNFALTAGDDYELCFTAPENHCEAIQEQLPHVRWIGKTESTKELKFYDNGKPFKLENSGFEH